MVMVMVMAIAMKMSLAMALLLAIAANVGVSTMVSSFRLTFTDFLDQRLASELYVRTDGPAQSAELAAFADGRVDAILPIQNADIRVAGQATEVIGARDHSTYRDFWVFLQSDANAWDRTFAGEAVVINEQLSRRGGLSVGDVIDVQDRAFEIVGVYGDYGNPIGQAVMAEAVFAD